MNYNIDMSEITYKDFLKIELRVGTIIKVEDFPEAIKPSYKLWIDFGELGIKKSSAQIKKFYKKEELIGKQVIAVYNLPPKRIANFSSECLILGVILEENEVVLIQPDRKVPNGKRIL